MESQVFRIREKSTKVVLTSKIDFLHSTVQTGKEHATMQTYIFYIRKTGWLRFGFNLIKLQKFPIPLSLYKQPNIG